MEHEVNVPFSVGSVRAALAEPDRVARCVPGLQIDAPEGGTADASGPDTAEGRLRLRIGNSTITYRGSLTVTPKGEEFAVEGSGTEARGSGSVRLKLTVVPRRAKEGEGTRLVFTGTVDADGRLAEFEDKTAASAGQRLLERFGKALAESIEQDEPQALDSPAAPAAQAETTQAETPQAGGIGEPDDNERVIPGIPGPAPDSSEAAAGDGAAKAGTNSKGGKEGSEPDGKDSAAGASGQKAEDRPEERTGEKSEEDAAPGEPSDADRPERGGVFETEVPPSSLDPLYDEEAGEETDVTEAEAKAAAEAEAAHARRTMIGRSAEEVDHAPPRGRYAPVPVPEPIANSAAVRWVAPAAAAVVAGAVFIGRALRRRR
ncbi:Carbon monoxide dehydrogenase subunit G [Streptomyces sp. WMMB 714]|nr:SRPBCC family protein [Streptomyces sp. WMMB 714]SCK25102.1 Carbon monoxide dehydrogenase subunit G [Streptomyces sp. WMMB 714]